MSVVRSSSEERYISPILTKAEYMAVSALHPRFGSTFVVIVYHPPRAAHFDGLFDAIEDLLSSFKCCVLMGDFNYDLRGDSTDAADFLLRLASFGLDVPRFSHTYTDHHGQSELDILASYGFKRVRHELGTYALIGGHVPLYADFELESLPDGPAAPQQTLRLGASGMVIELFRI